MKEVNFLTKIILMYLDTILLVVKLFFLIRNDYFAKMIKHNCLSQVCVIANVTFGNVFQSTYFCNYVFSFIV